MERIIEQINSMGRAFCGFSLPMLVQSSAVIVILLAADLLLRRKVRAVFRYWLWMLVLVKLVLPVTLSSPVSLGRWVGDSLRGIMVSDTGLSAVDSGSDEPAAGPIVLPGEVHFEAATVTPKQEYREAAPAEAAAGQRTVSWGLIKWQGVFFLAWLTAVVVMGLLVLQRVFFVRGLVAQAKEANGLMKDALRFCCGRMGVKGEVGLKVSANAVSPAVCGLFRPVILLPENLASSVGISHLRAVLMHELAHIKRGDLWVNLVQTVLQIVYFYNPLLWFANAVIRRIREQAVDEAVLVAMGDKAQQYPETLLNVAKLAFKRQTLSLRLIGVVESKSTLQARIKRILNRPIPKSAKLGIIGLAGVLIVGTVLLPMAKGKIEKKDIGRQYELFSERSRALINAWKRSNSSVDEIQATYLVVDTDSECVCIERNGEVSDSEKIGLVEGLKWEIYHVTPSGKVTLSSPVRLNLRSTRAEENVTQEVFLFNGRKDYSSRGCHFEISRDGYGCGLHYAEKSNLTFPVKELASNAGSADAVDKTMLVTAEEYDRAMAHTAARKKPATFAAVLPNGVTVELLGICEHPSKGKQWWRPDGNIIETKCFKHRTIRVHKTESLHANKEIVVRWNGPNEPTLMTFKFDGQPGCIAGFDVEGINGDLSQYQGLVEEFTRGQKTAKISFAVACGRFSKQLICSRGGSSGQIDDGRFTIGKVLELDEQAVVTISHDISDYEVRVRAKDNDNKWHIGKIVEGQATSGLMQATYVFERVRAKSIAGVVLETRPITWVTFKKVSLKPNFKTDVQIEVATESQSQGKTDVEGEGRESPFAATLANGVTVELVGLGTAPWESEQQWWQPDGTKIDKPEFKANDPPHKWPTGPNRLQFQCAALLRFSNYSGKNITVPSVECTNILLRSGLVSRIADDGSQITYIVSPPNEILPDSTYIKLAVCGGKFIQAERVEHYIPDQHQIYVLEDKSTVILHPLRTGQIGTPCVDLTCTQRNKNIEFRLTAELKNGETEQWHGGSVGKEVKFFQATPKRENTKIEDIKGLIIEYRPYSWVTFKNISLKPGVKTDVEVFSQKGDEQTYVVETRGQKRFVTLVITVRGISFGGKPIKRFEQIPMVLAQVSDRENTVLQVVASRHIMRNWEFTKAALTAWSREYGFAGITFVGEQVPSAKDSRGVTSKDSAVEVEGADKKVEQENHRPGELLKEAKTVMTKFQQALKASEWNKALSLCSDIVQSEAKKYESAGIFFKEVVPVEQIISVSNVQTFGGKFGPDNKRLAYFCFLRLSEPDARPTINWEWRLNKTDSGWVVGFKNIPLGSWIEQERLRLNREHEKAKERDRILQEGLKLSLVPLSDGFVIGQRMLFRLEMTNISGSPIAYEKTSFLMFNNPITVIAPGGERLVYIDSDVQSGCAGPVNIESNQTVILAGEYDVTTQYQITQPGQYTFQFTGHWVLKSNIVRMDIKPGEPLSEDVIIKKLQSVLPKDWTFTKTRARDIADLDSEKAEGLLISLTGKSGNKGTSKGPVGIIMLISPTEYMLEITENEAELWGQSQWGPVYVKSLDAELLWPDYKEQITKALSIQKLAENPAAPVEGNADKYNLMARGGKGRVEALDPNAANLIRRYLRALEKSDWKTALSMCSISVMDKAQQYPTPESFFNIVVPVKEILNKLHDPRIGYWLPPPKYFAYIFDVRISQPDLPRDVFWVWKARRLEGRANWEIDFPAIPFETWLANEKREIIRVAQEKNQLIKELAPRLKGVRLLLTAKREEFVVGEPIYFRLRIINQGDSILSYDCQQVTVNNSMTIEGPDGKEVKYTAGPFQTFGGPVLFKPGETKTLFDQFDITEQYDIRQPGEYRVQFNGNNLSICIAKEDPPDLNDISKSFEYYPGILPSNVVIITIHSGIKQETLDVGKDGVESEKAVSQTNTEDKPAVQVEGGSGVVEQASSGAGEEETRGSKLEFRILPDSVLSSRAPSPLRLENEMEYRKDMRENGPDAGRRRGDEYIWLEVEKYEPAKFSLLVIEKIGEKSYVLAANLKNKMMLADGTWGLQKVYPKQDLMGRSGIGFEFDKKSDELFYQFTSSNINNRLAIIINGKIYSAPQINSAIRGEGIITGDFTEAEVAKVIGALKKGMPAVAPKPRGQQPGFDPVVEITLNDSIAVRKNSLIDFDTGKLFSLPDDWYKTHDSDKALQWIISNGVDAFGATRNTVRGLDCEGMIFVSAPNSYWDKFHARSLATSDLWEMGKPGRPAHMTGKGELPATYIFKTREGGIGILQITGFNDEPRGVNIRYKMLKDYNESNFSGQVEGEGNLEQGLIAYWHFNGDAKDSVGNNDGVLHGATLTDGVSGQAYYFEGDGDSIEIPDADVFDFGAGDFTISAWFKTGVNKAPFPFIVNFRQDDNNPHIELYASRDLGTHLLPGDTRITYSQAGINDDRWHHVAVTMENGIENGYRLYLDGIKVGHATYVGNLKDWDTIAIGAQKKGGDKHSAYKGSIDEVSVYNRALCAEEIRRVYENILKSGYFSPKTHTGGENEKVPGFFEEGDEKGKRDGARERSGQKGAMKGR